ncbi:heavy metal translocating P-type ATPase [Undibacterium sp. TS12]|uniref:heavy metal translocating P-type ATPase n=1 Tax=Undibacterium sp. TS12 TaxID=2908202 RepID=UPI001F4CB9C5|nr:heavy metal translocating P-type ATPase [Undibacterium sp. TS12]MCH8618736.1 heavy metal translocating P-type ATPase [Undibacterium sp. TS12]
MSEQESGCCGCNSKSAGNDKTPSVSVVASPNDNAEKVLNLLIEQMDCPTEEALLRHALEKMPGVNSLDFNLINRRLSIKHTITNTSVLIDTITALGMSPVQENVQPPNSVSMVVYSIENMDCPTEEGLIRDKLGPMPGIAQLDFNLMQRKLTVSHTLANHDVIQAVLTSIGMKAVLLSEDGKISPDATEIPPANTSRKWRLLGAAVTSAILAEAFAYIGGSEKAWPVMVLSAFAILLSGTGTYKKGWIALKNLNLNINALMAIAVTGALIIGQWPEAAMVMVLFSLSEAIEAMSLDRARNAIRGLMAMTPETASVLQADGSWLEIAAKAIAVGATVRVSPGERIPLDGELSKGQSSVNQAPITGESMPVAKTVGDRIFAGTINETGSFEYRVTALQTDSTLSRIIHAVEEAQGSRAPTQRFVDSFAKVYTPIVFVLALGVMLIPPLLLGSPWLDWVYKALVLLVIACPCALVVSTPVTVVSGLAAAAKAGILIKGGVYLEEGRKLKSLALDKTGTITQGKPVVTDVRPLGDDQAKALQLAASLAGRSDHPVSGAVTAYWKTQGNEKPALEVSDFAAIAGRGVKGQIAGKWYYLGNHRLIEELGICSADTEAALQVLEADGKTAVIIADEQRPLAVIGVADTVRESSREAIAELHALGIRTVMLTGDNEMTAKAIAKSVGIDDARGNLLPEDKLAAINDELANHGNVGMVGDGINDAPALAKSSIGFAMGAAGTDTALETADVALMDDDLRKIPQFIRLSQRTAAILKQNIALALSIKLAFLIMAVMGVATLWMAVFADMGASLLVIFNGLRLVRRMK